MTQHQQLVMESQEPRIAVAASVGPGIKTILLHIIDDEFHDQRIESALALTRACSAHLSCVHVTPIEAYVAFDKFGGVFVMNDIIRKLDERDYELKCSVEKRLGGEDVSWDYEQVTGHVPTTIIRHAALADLLVTTRQPRLPGVAGPTVGFLGDLLHRSRTPLFLPSSDGAQSDPTGLGMIAWDGSVEAANAVRSSVGLLKVASEVRVIEISEQKANNGPKTFPATKVLEYLSRQGIHAELVVESAPSGDAGEDVVAGMLVAQASGSRAAYMVMGGYSHTRLGEFVFGGVTRTLLKECPVPLIIAH